MVTAGQELELSTGRNTGAIANDISGEERNRAAKRNAAQIARSEDAGAVAGVAVTARCLHGLQEAREVWVALHAAALASSKDLVYV